MEIQVCWNCEAEFPKADAFCSKCGAASRSDYLEPEQILESCLMVLRKAIREKFGTKYEVWTPGASRSRQCECGHVFFSPGVVVATCNEPWRGVQHVVYFAWYVSDDPVLKGYRAMCERSLKQFTPNPENCELGEYYGHFEELLKAYVAEVFELVSEYDERGIMIVPPVRRDG